MINDTFGKKVQNVRNRLGLELFKKDDTENVFKQQSKLTFNGIHKTYEIFDSYTFKQSRVFKDKLIYVGCAVLKLLKLHLYETYYDKLQPYFGQENIHYHYIDTDAFVLSLNTKNIIKDLKNLEDFLDFSHLIENHELISDEKEKVIGNFTTETPKNFWIDEIVCLRSKVYPFKCEDGNESKNKLKVKT